MNPPIDQNPEYVRGYRDGYRDRGIYQALHDLSEISGLSPDQVDTMCQLVQKSDTNTTDSAQYVH